MMIFRKGKKYWTVRRSDLNEGWTISIVPLYAEKTCYFTEVDRLNSGQISLWGDIKKYKRVVNDIGFHDGIYLFKIPSNKKGIEYIFTIKSQLEFRGLAGNSQRHSGHKI